MWSLGYVVLSRFLISILIEKQDLPQQPTRGKQRHHIKEASGFGTDRWTVKMTIQLTEEEFAAHLRESQRQKGQRGDISEEDRDLGSLKIDYSGALSSVIAVQPC